jgi:hypothetical protein
MSLARHLQTQWHYSRSLSLDNNEISSLKLYSTIKITGLRPKAGGMAPNYVHYLQFLLTEVKGIMMDRTCDNKIRKYMQKFFDNTSQSKLLKTNNKDSRCVRGKWILVMPL